MARLLGPDANSRLVYSVVGPRLASQVAATATVYADAAGTVLADIRTYDGTQTPGAAIAGSALTVDANSLLPLFWLPDGVDKVYVKVGLGPVTAVNADYDARLDAIVGVNYRGTWAATTAYAINDLTTLGGDLLLCKTAHTSTAPFSLANWSNLTGKPGVYNVALYGAKGDGASDDTAAINAAVSAAYNGGVADGSYAAEVYFPPATYILSSPTTKGGATQGNAQIPLPNPSQTGRKFTLTFAGLGDGSANPHWMQTVGQRSGSVLKTTLTGQAADPTWGVPSVVGGPTVDQGSGIFANLKVVVRNIMVSAPFNPSMQGFDLRRVAQATVLSLGCMADAGPAGNPALSTLPTNTNGLALAMPANLNNDCAVVLDFMCEGFYYGMSIGEHFTALRVAIIYAQVGVFIGVASASLFHGASIANLSVEASGTAIQCGGTAGGNFPLWVGMLGTETTTTAVDDPQGSLNGTLMWSDIAATKPAVNGAASMKVVAVSGAGKPGAVTGGNIPAVPASTTALKNPIWRDCAVTVSGGTVTAIAVDGVATGITSGTVFVPSGKTITLTYSVAPTWVWVAL